jgi:hypothetical protein
MHSHINVLMMGTEMVPETVVFNELTQPKAHEDSINVSHCESITSYKCDIA